MQYRTVRPDSTVRYGSDKYSSRHVCVQVDVRRRTGGLGRQVLTAAANNSDTVPYGTVPYLPVPYGTVPYQDIGTSTVQEK